MASSSDPGHFNSTEGVDGDSNYNYSNNNNGGNPPTVAAFSPTSASPASRSSFQVHQKSPLLVATPPQVTRSLSRAYPWVRSLNYVMGLLTWTTPDPWESFVVVATFWGVALYGDFLVRWGGNVIAVVLLIAGMFLRRYQRAGETATTTLDEILGTLNTLNSRIEVFFVPFVTLLHILSSEKNATTATTRPALTTLFVRILLLSPLWLVFAVYPFNIITPRRVLLFCGTLMLSWHSRPAKVSRTILWRSTALRTLSERLTGLSLSPEFVTLPPPPPLPARSKADPKKPTPLDATTASASPGVKFTFAIYENQRRWLGVGWTSTLFAYERAAWTDEHLQPCGPPTEFMLPETPRGGGVRWRWVPGEAWEVEGVGHGSGGHSRKQELKDRLGGPGGDGEGWWYYDNKWRDGRRGVDGWGKYTRRRKWCRRAELVEEDEIESETESSDVSGGSPVKEGVVVEEGGVEAGEKADGKPVPPPLPPREREREREVLEEDGRDVSDSENEGGRGKQARVDAPTPPPLPARK